MGLNVSQCDGLGNYSKKVKLIFIFLSKVIKKMLKLTPFINLETASVSVYDKQGIEKFGKFMSTRLQIRASDGTTRCLLKDGCPNVSTITSITGYNEMLGGRVKTLHPVIHGTKNIYVFYTCLTVF